ncbi:MAG: hypothetical protein ACE5F6_00025 [Anaerolineae bacterium]
MGILQNTVPKGMRIFHAQREIKRAKGKSDPEIQAVVNEAVRVGSPSETTSQTLQRMRLTEEKINQFMRAAYPYPSPPT